ncbi:MULTISPECIES: DUF4231 domain-containing protein [Aminobacterium]|jgi:hypothetical protein|uniref:DUF4231 domain-containing protein n=1 Tax=Aminobacterium TaxID=81466 RepID=UPI00257EA9F0|nr:DUF4231 domain-containing protein [Aminobacterium sp. UBA4987]
MIHKEATKITPEEYVKLRLENQIEWYSQKSSWNKKWYERLKRLELAMAAAIPVCVGFLDGPIWLRGIIALLGASLVVIGGLHGLHNFHENWIEYRATSETLKHEWHFYNTKTGPYKNEDDPFSLLVDRTEGIISHENLNWGMLCTGEKKTKSH